MSYRENEIVLEFDAISENEGLARVVIAAFLTKLDPTIEQLDDVKTAVSEAVTNAIIHAYQEKGGKVVMRAALSANEHVKISISDTGIGIDNVEQAMQPLYTTGADKERSGMGFAFMEAFMDRVEVKSEIGKGTTVHMWKSFSKKEKKGYTILQAAMWSQDGGL